MNTLNTNFQYDKVELGQYLDKGLSYMELKNICLHAYAAKKPLQEVAQLREKYGWIRVKHLLGLTPEKFAKREMEYKAERMERLFGLDKKLSMKYMKLGYGGHSVKRAMRNPQKDVRVLKFKAELIDKYTSKHVPGLMTAGKVVDEEGHGWGGSSGDGSETTAMISLHGKKNQTFILPLYVDYFTVLEGDYNLRITVSGNGQEKIQEVPIAITKKHNTGLMSVGFSFFCALATAAFSYRLPRCIKRIGARGAITVALFAALAFGGITLPTTLLGDLLHVFLGPFSGLVTGVLSGVLQYLLIVSLLTLFREPGVLALMFFVKYMLSGLMFGHFTPLGALSTCVSVIVLEAVLYLCGFYKVQQLNKRYMLFVAVLLGLADAAVTFINLEQMMFFYRLYYADWYMALYMLINGLLYSSIGAWLGFKTGSKLQQVMGE